MPRQTSSKGAAARHSLAPAEGERDGVRGPRSLTSSAEERFRGDTKEKSAFEDRHARTQASIVSPRCVALRCD